MHGDYVIEGRHGNSLRIGSRDIYPNIIFSNNRLPHHTKESFYDGSLISMTTKGSIFDHFLYPGGYSSDTNQETFVLASDSVEEPNFFIGDTLYNYEYDSNQLFQNSKKITINAYGDGIFLSSFMDTVIGAGNNVRINSNFDIRLNAETIYLGGEDHNAESELETEPMVRGDKLTTFLKSLVEILIKSHGLVQGVPIPLTDNTGNPLVTEFQNLYNELAEPNFLSDIVFIESENRQ